MKKLYKSDVDRKLCGVCGGIAGILAYIIAALVIPDYPNKII